MAAKAIIAIGGIAIAGFIVWQLLQKGGSFGGSSSSLGASQASNPSVSTPADIGNGLTASPTASGQNINISENINYSPTSTETLTTTTSTANLTNEYSTNNTTNSNASNSSLLGIGTSASANSGKKWWVGL